MSSSAARRAGAWLAIAIALLGTPRISRAAECDEAAAERPWLAFGALTGGIQSDAALADYQWDTSARLAWGLEALAGRGRWAAGVRLWSHSTTQRLDFGSESVSPRVRSTSIEVVGRARVATWRGTHLVATADAGRLHLGYDPDRVEIPTGGSGGTVEARLGPENEWVAGAGAGLERALGAGWTLGMNVERRMWALDTAHRSGSEIVMARESFGEWNARFEFARVLARR